jgi:hypothetical protein
MLILVFVTATLVGCGNETGRPENLQSPPAQAARSAAAEWVTV